MCPMYEIKLLWLSVTFFKLFLWKCIYHIAICNIFHISDQRNPWGHINYILVPDSRDCQGNFGFPNMPQNKQPL